VAVIGGLATRTVGHHEALRSAHDEHGVVPGPHDDCAAPAYMQAAGEIYRMTLSAEYLDQLGVTFGATAVLMEAVARMPEVELQSPQWEKLGSYFAAVADELSPDHLDRIDSLSSFDLVHRPTPAIIRFDLLAELVSRAAVIRCLDAASWVAEAVKSVEVGEAAMSPIGLASLAATKRV